MIPLLTMFAMVCGQITVQDCFFAARNIVGMFSVTGTTAAGAATSAAKLSGAAMEFVPMFSSMSITVASVTRCVLLEFYVRMGFVGMLERKIFQLCNARDV